MICRMLILFFLCFCMFSSYSAETDTLKQGGLVRDWENLTSANGMFTLGFFTLSSATYPTMSTNHYLGIFYVATPNNPVWVANRDTPVLDSSGAAIVDTDGRLKITHLGGTITISNHSTLEVPASRINNVSATLLDSGNLVLRESYANGSFGPILWQSFDYPTSNLIPGMKLGVNLKTGHRWTLTSWLSDTIPSPGAFELGIDSHGANRLVISKRGEVYWKSGVWKNGSFENTPDITQTNYGFGFRFVSNEKEKYFSYYVKHDYTSARWELDLLGQIIQFYRISNTSMNSWNWRYAAECLPNLESNDGAVCLKEKPVACRKSSDVFVKTRGYFTDGQISYDESPADLALSDCHATCWKNCSCTAYASSTTDGIGCYLWMNASNFTVSVNDELNMYVLNHIKSKV